MMLVYYWSAWASFVRNESEEGGRGLYRATADVVHVGMVEMLSEARDGVCFNAGMTYLVCSG